MKYALVLIFMIMALTGMTQTGIYGWTSNITAAKLHLYKQLGYTGVRYILPWYIIQPTQANLSFSSLKTTIKQISDSGINMELQVWVGQYSPISKGGVTWLADLGVETFSTSGGIDNGPWPNYYDPVYIAAWKTLHKALADTLFNLPPDQKTHVKSSFISIGSTGDLQPYKGDPIPGGSFGIFNDATWQAFYIGQWDTAYSYYRKDTGFMVNSFNMGQNAEVFDYILSAYPDAYIKEGDRTHEYPLQAENKMANWPRGKIYFGEVDDYIKLSPHYADQFQCIRSALNVYTTRLDFMDEWNNNLHVPDYVDFFYKYYNQYDSVTANRGFCVLAEKINYLDTVNYPVSIYGPLYLNQQQYNQSVNLINASSDGVFRKQMRIVQAAVNQRVLFRVNLLQTTGAGFNPQGYYYNHDITWDCHENYNLNIGQLRIQETSLPLYRIDNGSIYGRNARIAIPFENKTALYFSVSNYLTVSNTNDSVIFTITYKDIGTALWEAQVYQCERIQVINENTGTWKTLVFNVANFEKGHLMRYGADLIVEVINGDAFPVDMVEFNNTSK